MKIIREINNIPMEFELTPEEIRTAYDEQKMNYHIEDAALQIKNWLNGRDGLRSSIIETFSDPNSQNYILPVLAERFEAKYDCNLDENSQWENIIWDTILPDYLELRATEALSEYLKKYVDDDKLTNLATPNMIHNLIKEFEESYNFTDAWTYDEKAEEQWDVVVTSVLKKLNVQ